MTSYQVIGNMAVAEDFDFLLRAVTAGFQLGNLPEALMRVRIRPGQNSGSVQQRKSHAYIVRLYRERLKNGWDSFSLASYQRATRTCRLEDLAFRFAQKCNQKGIQSGSKLLRITLAGLSTLASPWQARYFVNRLQFKMAWRAAMRPR